MLSLLHSGRPKWSFGLSKCNRVKSFSYQFVCFQGESVSTRETGCKPHLSATVEIVPMGEQGPPSTTTMTGSVAERSTPLATNFQMDHIQGNQTPGNIAAVREKIVTPVGSISKATPGSTPRRPKRKFPGPAGLLPKLV